MWASRLVVLWLVSPPSIAGFIFGRLSRFQGDLRAPVPPTLPAVQGSAGRRVLPGFARPRPPAPADGRARAEPAPRQTPPRPATRPVCLSH